MTTASLFLLLSVSLQGQEARLAGDLQPEWKPGGIDGTYEVALSHILLPTDENRRSALLVRPALSTEWSVYVSGSVNDKKIVLRALSKPLTLEESAKPAVVAVAAKIAKETTAPLSLDVATKLEATWRVALARVRYSKAERDRMAAGADGENYHFSQCDQQGCLSGMTWSPTRGSISGLMVEVGEAMRSYALDKAPGREARLAERIEAFTKAVRGE